MNEFNNLKKLVFLIVIFSSHITTGQTIKSSAKGDSLCGVAINYDKSKKMLPRYFPNDIGKAYQKVITVTSEFVTYRQPLDPRSNISLLYSSCCFEGPHMTKSTEVIQGKSIGGKEKADFNAVDWTNNPACIFAGLTQGLGQDMYGYTGNEDYKKITGKMLTHMINNGTTPSNFRWANVPYASSDPKDTVYVGGTTFEHDGMRGDGLHGIEPDKVGEMGYAYIRFYEITGEEKYLKAALNCADALAKHIDTTVILKPGQSASTQTKISPWPFRLNARTGKVYDTYCAHVVEPIKMFDEILRIKDKIKLDSDKVKKYTTATNYAFKWLYSTSGPMKTYIWNAYFEDIVTDEEQANRTQISPMETARYLLNNPSKAKQFDADIMALIYYVKSAFGDPKFNAINEQTWCYEPMASHTSRYASVCAMYYAKTKNEWFKEEALRHFNYATYSVEPNGVAWVGPTWPGSWWSDGYADFIKHYFDGIAAIPEWAPARENHVLKSTSAIKNIVYADNSIKFKTFDNNGNVTLRLKSKPKSITIGGKNIAVSQNAAKEAYELRAIGKDFAVTINYTSGNDIAINL